MIHKINHWINNLRILIAIFIGYFFNSCLPNCTCNVDSPNWSFPITLVNKKYHPTKPVTYVTCREHGVSRLYEWGMLDRRTGTWGFSGVLSLGEEDSVIKELELEAPSVVVSNFIAAGNSQFVGNL